MNKDSMEVIVTDKKTVKHFFQTVLYDTVLTNTDEVIISTIDKHRYIAEKQLLPFLKIYGFVLNEDVHQEEELKPIEEKKEYNDGKIVTYLKYHLIRDPYNKEVMRETLKNKEVQKAFTYLLNKLDVHRKELDDEEAMNLWMSLFHYSLRKDIKQLKAFEKYIDSFIKEKMK